MAKFRRAWFLVLLVLPMLFFGLRFYHRKLPIPSEVETILNSATSFELVSLEPEFDRGVKRPAEAYLQGYLVLGRRPIDKEVNGRGRAAIVSTIREGIIDSGVPEGTALGCIFEPRHAISATADGTTVDILICFHCGEIEMYEGDRQVGHRYTSRDAKVMLNALLQAADVPLSVDPHPEAGASLTVSATQAK